MGKENIVVISHSGEEDLNELMTKLVLLKVRNELDPEKFYKTHTIAIHREK